MRSSQFTIQRIVISSLLLGTICQDRATSSLRSGACGQYILRPPFSAQQRHNVILEVLEALRSPQQVSNK